MYVVSEWTHKYYTLSNTHKINDYFSFKMDQDIDNVYKQQKSV